MSIRHLRIFIMVAECKNMSLAAKKLFITQPSVSQVIKEIEDYYGVRLFERLSKRLFLTESGELLLKYARNIVVSFDDMEMKLKNKGQYINLRVGATITVGNCMLNNIIDKLEERNQNISTKIIINNTKVIESMLLKSELDVGIVEGIISNKDIVKKPIYKDKLIAVVGKSHKLYNKNKILLEEIKGEDIISREEGSGSKSIFDKILKEKNIDVNIKLSSTDTEVIKKSAIQGMGIAVLSSLMVEKEIKNGTLRELCLKDVDMFRDIYVVYHKNKFISEFLKCFLDNI